MDELKKMRFDPTINLGHVITFLGFILTIFIGWTNLDKRVVVLEETRNMQALRDKHQDSVIASQSSQIRESLNEIKAAMVRLEKKIDDVAGRQK